MIASLKAEFRKILTIRSTYIILGISLAAILLFAFYGEGFRYTGPTNDPFYLRREISNALNALALFIVLIGILLVTHEYRYNTITYTLTTSNSRTKTFIAKAITVAIYGLILTVTIATLAPLMTALGLRLQGVQMVHQIFYFKDIVWHTLLYGWGFAMYGFILAMLIRNQIGTIVSLFIIPAMVEPLLGIVLKANQKYLPYASLNLNLINDVTGQNFQNSYSRVSLVPLIYFAIGLIVSWILFVRRDAN